jgi:hypothetical protein
MFQSQFASTPKTYRKKTARAVSFLRLTFSFSRYIEGFNMDIMKDPVGKASFDPQKNDVDVGSRLHRPAERQNRGRIQTPGRFGQEHG